MLPLYEKRLLRASVTVHAPGDTLAGAYGLAYNGAPLKSLRDDAYIRYVPCYPVSESLSAGNIEVIEYDRKGNRPFGSIADGKPGGEVFPEGRCTVGIYRL